MKKNLRIVSAAAAALLAVAPVAASAVSVNAATNITNITLGGTKAPAAKGDVVLTSNVKAVTTPVAGNIDYTNGTQTVTEWDGRVNGDLTVSINNQSYTANLGTDSAVTIYIKQANGSFEKVKPDNDGNYDLVPGGKYYVKVANVGLNLGSANANLNQKLLTSSNGVQFWDGKTWQDSLKINTDRNGTATLSYVLVPVDVTDVTNAKSVSFYDKTTGNEVQNGSLNMTANPTSHQLNVSAVLAAAKAKYAAHQLEAGASNGRANVEVGTSVSDLTDQLTKAGISVDANGNFTAPASFSFNLTAKSAQNAATATLPVTVSVANAAQTPAAQETTKNVTIMHISTIYDKTGKATNEPALRAYDTVSVVSDPVTINKAKFYKLAGKDQYIKVGNVDGTSRTLKHNSYVYKSSGKRANKKTLKKGSSVTTYGKSFMIAGHQMYRIGKNQYVKKANF